MYVCIEAEIMFILKMRDLTVDSGFYASKW